MKIKTIISFSLLVVFLISSCQLFSSSNVETIVKESNLSYLYLSPNGDYLIYDSPRSKGDFLLNLATKQEYEFDCELRWLKNYHVGCYKFREESIIDAQSGIKIPLILLNPQSNRGVKPEYNNLSSINEFLVDAEIIYRPDWLTDTVYILAPNYLLNLEENYIVTNLPNPDVFLSKYSVITVTIPSSSKNLSKKTFSPDGLYYCAFTGDGFAIYDANNNQIISEFVQEENVGTLDILGWSPDSSGVYFYTRGYIYSFISRPPDLIRKLTIPDE